MRTQPTMHGVRCLDKDAYCDPCPGMGRPAKRKRYVRKLTQPRWTSTMKEVTCEHRLSNGKLCGAPILVPVSYPCLCAEHINRKRFSGYASPYCAEGDRQFRDEMLKEKSRASM